jgi:cell division septation protein DedD
VTSFPFSVPQTSKSAVPQVSKPAGDSAVVPAWKPAARQVWKPAARKHATFALNAYAVIDRRYRPADDLFAKLQLKKFPFCIFTAGRRPPGG